MYCNRPTSSNLSLGYFFNCPVGYIISRYFYAKGELCFLLRICNDIICTLSVITQDQMSTFITLDCEIICGVFNGCYNMKPCKRNNQNVVPQHAFCLFAW